MSKKNYRWSLALVLVGGFLVKLVWLGYPEDHYFDEVYHAYTAQQYVHNNPDAYDPWGRAPKGKANEWTHPPLTKLIMAGSMMMMGENPVGWRFSSVVFGTMVIWMAALLSMELFKSRRASVFTAFVLSVEGLLFAQSRIAMNDVHFLFFGLMSIYCYLIWQKKDNNLWILGSGLSLGLALASKWTAFYVLGVIGLDFVVKGIRLNRPSFTKFLFFAFSLSILPGLIYLAAYLHYFSLGFNWTEFVELQKQMYWYHTNLDATHTYQSRPWQWVLNLRPVWYYTNNDQWELGKMANIYNLANPVVLYGGIGAVGLAIYSLMKKWQWELWFVLLAYFGLFAPWIFSPRIMFSYHYLPSVAWLSILLGWCLNMLSRTKILRPMVCGYIGLCLVWFVIFYPNMTGLPVPKEIFEKIYFVIPSWR